MKIMRLDTHGNLTLAGSLTEVASAVGVPPARLKEGGLDTFEIIEDPTLDKLMVWSATGIKIKGEIIEGGTL